MFGIHTLDNGLVHVPCCFRATIVVLQGAECFCWLQLKLWGTWCHEMPLLSSGRSRNCSVFCGGEHLTASGWWLH